MARGRAWASGVGVPPRSRSSLALGLPVAVYLGASFALFFRVWAGDLPHTFLSGYGDPGQEIWFLGWMAHALSSGLNPFFSTAMFAPRGVNLMANTTFPLLGAILSPLTLAAGPVVSFDLALTLAPALSASSAYIVLRRLAPWPPAAALGGAAFGFSPALLSELQQGHLQVTFLPLVPVLAALVTDACAAQKGRPATTGVLLGLSVAAQALIGPEVLAITALTLATVVAISAATRPRQAALKVAHAAKTLGLAAAVAGLLLAFPLWFAFGGPRHLIAPVPVSPLGTPLESLALPGSWATPLDSLAAMGYLGIPLLLVVSSGLAVFRRSGLLQASALLAVVAVILGLGTHLRLTAGSTPSIPLPAALLAHVPLLRQIAPVRFTLLAPLGAGAAVALVLDRRRARLRNGAGPAPARRTLRNRTIALAATAVLAVTSVGLVPLDARLPYPVRRVDEPAVYARLGPGRVLSYPLVSQFVSDQLVWQALEGFRFELVEGYAYVPSGPKSDSLVLGPSPVVTAFADAELGLPVAAGVASVRAELRALGVSEVVLVAGKGAGQAGRLVGEAAAAPLEHVDGALVIRISR